MQAACDGSPPRIRDGDIEVEAGGERLVLLPEKAALVPRTGTLLVADVHLGKAATFRARGVPVPRGTTTATLERLDAVLARLPVARVVFLGDLLHGPDARAATTMAAVCAWRAVHPQIELLLVRGNHDRHAGDPPATLRIRSVPEPWVEGGLALCHTPVPREDGFVVAGHVHPAFVLRGRGRQRARLPCFSIGPRVAVLPAFGAFTGMADITPGPGERIYVVADDCVVPVPVTSPACGGARGGRGS
jgi:DNA ligase-associated metallophosphoesterase